MGVVLEHESKLSKHHEIGLIMEGFNWNSELELWTYEETGERNITRMFVDQSGEMGFAVYEGNNLVKESQFYFNSNSFKQTFMTMNLALKEYIESPFYLLAAER